MVQWRLLLSLSADGRSSDDVIAFGRPWTKANKVPCEPINPKVLASLMGLGAVPWNSALWRTRCVTIKRNTPFYRESA